jgi:hypothetical protein
MFDKFLLGLGLILGLFAVALIVSDNAPLLKVRSDFDGNWGFSESARSDRAVLAGLDPRKLVKIEKHSRPAVAYWLRRRHQAKGPRCIRERTQMS